MTPGYNSLRVSLAMPQVPWSDCLGASLLTTVMLLVFHRSTRGSECPVCPGDLESLGLCPFKEGVGWGEEGLRAPGEVGLI